MDTVVSLQRIGLVILFFLLRQAVSGQELTLMAGTMSTPNLNEGSYAWQIEYRHGLYENFEASLSWINEGHVDGHHRDGNALQLWYRLPFNQNLFRLSAGVGPYYFYDTQPAPHGDSVNLHGTAAIVSLSAEGDIHDRFFWRLSANRIEANSDIKTNSILLGVGYWLGEQDHLPKGNMPGIFEPSPVSSGREARNEFTVFGGWSVVNTLFSEGARSFATEYRRDLTPNIDFTVSYVYEGDPKIIRRSGMALQVWPVSKSFGAKFEVGFGMGVYVYIDRRHLVASSQKRQAALAGMASPMLSYRITDSIFARLIWNRVITNYNRDADIWLVGLGCRL